MRIHIRYCRPCRYRLRAEHLAERLRQEFACSVTLEAGNFGIFRIWVDDDIAFDKYRAVGWVGRFGFGKVPPDDVVIQSLRAHLASRQLMPEELR